LNRIRKNNIHNLLKASFELANESIFLINEKGELVFVNSTGCENLSYSRKEILNLKVWDIDVMVDNEEKFTKKFNEFLLVNDDKPIILQSFHQRKDKKITPVEITSRIIEINETN